jgi:hypothetical protein
LPDDGPDANGDVVVVQAAVENRNILDVDERRAVAAAAARAAARAAASGYELEFLIG